MSKLLSARASAQKGSEFDVRGAVHHQSHGSSSPKAEQALRAARLLKSFIHNSTISDSMQH
eukprot:2150418-Pleurochrysis_carterae.AAC.1